MANEYFHESEHATPRLRLGTTVPSVYGYIVVFLAGALSASAIFVSAANIVPVEPPPQRTAKRVVLPPTPEHKGVAVGRVAEHVLVKFKDNVGQTRRAEIMESHGLSEKDEIPGLKIKLMRVPQGQTPEEVVERLRGSEAEEVEFAEVDMLVAPSYIPNDPSYGNAWQLPKIGAPLAWDMAKGDGITVAVLDTGVDCTHPDLAVNCVTGWNVSNNTGDTTDIHGHGTKVAGTIAAVGDNAIGLAGVSYLSKIMPVRITDDTAGYASWSAIARGITYAADNGARIASNSYASSDSYSVQSAATYLRNKGGIFVAAAGNDSSLITYANPTMIVTAGATNSSDVRASWSNYGTPVDIAAPGVSVYTTVRGGGYGSVSGTSFATPITAATLGLIFSANPALTPAQAETILFSTAKDLGDAGWDQYYGWGRVDAGAAVTMALSTEGVRDTLAPSVPTNLSATALDGARVALSWTASTDNDKVSGYTIFRDGVKLVTLTGTTYTDTTVSPNMTYVYTVQASDASGNLSGMSASVSVTTPVLSVAITSSSVRSKTATTATVKWATNLPATGVVKYGTSKTALSSATPASSLGTSGQVAISGLTKKTTYYYQLVVTTADGATASSAVGSFTTKPK